MMDTAVLTTIIGLVVLVLEHLRDRRRETDVTAKVRDLEIRVAVLESRGFGARD